MSDLCLAARSGRAGHGRVKQIGGDFFVITACIDLQELVN